MNSSKSILAMTKRASTGRIWGDNLCLFRCLAVEHEGDEASLSSVSVTDITRRRSPAQLATLFSLWQEKRDDYEDVNPQDFLGAGRPLGTRRVV